MAPGFPDRRSGTVTLGGLVFLGRSRVGLKSGFGTGLTGAGFTLGFTGVCGFGGEDGIFGASGTVGLEGMTAGLSTGTEGFPGPSGSTGATGRGSGAEGATIPGVVFVGGSLMTGAGMSFSIGFIDAGGGIEAADGPFWDAASTP